VETAPVPTRPRSRASSSAVWRARALAAATASSCARMASLRSVESIRMSAWPRLTVWPASTKRSRTFPGIRNPRSLCTRAATIPANERSDWTEVSTVSIRTSGGCVRGSVEEDAASLHAAKTNGNTPMRVTRGTLRSCSMGASYRRPRPPQRPEPGAARDGGRIDEAGGDKPQALRQEYVRELTGAAQREPAGERRDRKAHHGAEERPQQAACSLRREVK